MILRTGDALQAVVDANERQERVLFVGGVCPTNPHGTVRAYLGPENLVESIFPGLILSVTQARPRGPVYGLVQSPRYKNVGVLQVSGTYPFLEPSIPILSTSLLMLGGQLEWGMTHVFSPDALGSGRFNQVFLPCLRSLSIPLTVWTGDISLTAHTEV